MKSFGAFLVGALSVLAAPAHAEPAPKFDLPTADGRISLESLHGKVVYLDFWASWCAPCRKSFPWMNDLQARYAKQGLTVVAVNLDKDRDLARRFLAEQKPSFTVAFDVEGDSARRFHVVGMPSSYLIDRSGNVVSRHVGFRLDEADAMERAIAALVNGTKRGDAP